MKRKTKNSKSLAGLLLAATVLSACATFKPPEVDYDTDVPPLPAPPPPAVEQPPKPVHIPPPWTPSRGGDANAPDTEARIVTANAAARVEPRREGYYNAIQVFPWSEGALYQIYAAPGRITDIALEPGEALIGPGPIAAGDTARWIIGDTTSGTGRDARVHILVKPTRPDIVTNLVLSTDRRTYLVEVRAREESYMPSVAWSYPRSVSKVTPPAVARPIIPTASERRYRYGLQGDTPPWRPTSVFDDGRRVYVVFPRGIVQGDMPPLFVIGPDGEAQIANTRVHGNVMIVDRLFAAAELRLGGEDQQRVRIVRIDGRRPS
ncbi:P-type conjugative transfer protein TrbG [Maribius pontilimi]|uniref:P-type conjugative transfer protein TrbG n=1 Tax=Palleronia pontilimi TaxID=1964209 RepID=A0A934MFK7_9RHOB|nr:P-type conjugative transfer protein TrbG [Palleronia pontilimi]MBJ3764626.1 P-type conjugative transfer protein TrbG [Palleronia pontilimi]